MRGLLVRIGMLLALLAPLPALAATYAMTTVVANWIDASAHSKITTNSTPYNFNGGGGCGTAPPTLDDVISDPIPIGFSFMFGGVNFTDLRVMTNGRLQFGTTTCGAGTQNIGPPQTFPYNYPDGSMNYTMRIYGGDLDVTLRRSASADPADSVNNYPTTCVDRNACYISYALIGTAPNRSFVVTWNNVPEWVNYTQTAGNFNLQIILQENGEFIYQYGATNYASTGRAQIGWQVDQQDYEVSQVGLPPSGTAFKYYVPRPVAEYRMEQPSWTGIPGEVLDTSGYVRHASGAGAVNTVDNAPGYICRGASIPVNTTAAVINAIATPVNVSTTVGSSGTISFWYKPALWSGGGSTEAMLFDATTATDQYFYLAKVKSGNNARLRFAIRDSGGTTRVVTTGNLTLNADGAVHIGVTWSFNPLAAASSDFLRIYVNGVRAAESLFTTGSSISASLGTLHIGDNRSAIVENAAYGRSANGVIDEFRIYNYNGGIGLILRDMNQASTCLSHYAIQHAGTGFTCTPSTVAVLAHAGNHANVIMPNNTTMIRLSTSTGAGDWSLISGYGALDNGTANDGQATYIFNGEYQAVFGLAHTTAGTVNINVTDGQIAELSPDEDANLVLSTCGVGSFNACEKTTPQCSPPKTSSNKYDRLFTKLADTAFDLDFVALKADGTLENGFNGTVDISLLANVTVPTLNTSTQCPTTASTATVSLGTLTFASGRATKAVAANAFAVVAPNYRAYKDVRVRFSCSLASCGQVINTCSTDGFTVRPQGLALGVTKSDGTTALNNASPSTGTPSLTAGADFLIAATGVAGYNGEPVIKRTVDDQTVVSHLEPDDYVGSLRNASGGATISLGFASALTGKASGTVQYHDYGQFLLKAGAVRDADFAGGDKTNGDCVSGSYSNTLNNGKYGCDVANLADTGLFGRFYPSHFAVSGTLTPGCSGGNSTYFDQPFTLNYSVSAMSLPNPQLVDSVPLSRYTAGTIALALYDNTGTVDLSTTIRDTATRTNRVDVGNWSAGVFTPTATNYLYSGATASPYNRTQAAPVMAGYLVVSAAHTPAGDNVSIKRATAANTTVSDTDFSVGTPNCVSGCTHKKVSGMPTSFRYGRARLQNAYGSELLDLPMTFRAEYWSGAATGWAFNSADTCTDATLSFAQVGATNITASTCVIEPGNVSGKGCAVAPAVANRKYLESGVTGTDSNGVAGFAGNFNLWLRAPGSGNAGTIRVDAVVPSWLQFNWTGTVGNPSARATFGVYRSGPIIHRREMY